MPSFFSSVFSFFFLFPATVLQPDTPRGDITSKIYIYFSSPFLWTPRETTPGELNVSGYDCPNAILVYTIRNQELCGDISARGATQLENTPPALLVFERSSKQKLRASVIRVTHILSVYFIVYCIFLCNLKLVCKKYCS